jgi:hypothetical protein
MFLGDMTAERDQRLEQGRQALRGRRRDFERQTREILVGASDLEMQHFECAAALDHRVEDRVQELRIDQVPGGRDDGSVRLYTGHVVGIIGGRNHYSDVV